MAGGSPGQMRNIWHKQGFPLLKTVRRTVFNSPPAELLNDREFRPLRRAAMGSSPLDPRQRGAALDQPDDFALRAKSIAASGD